MTPEQVKKQIRKYFETNWPGLLAVQHDKLADEWMANTERAVWQWCLENGSNGVGYIVRDRSAKQVVQNNPELVAATPSAVEIADAVDAHLVKTIGRPAGDIERFQTLRRLEKLNQTELWNAAIEAGFEFKSSAPVPAQPPQEALGDTSSPSKSEAQAVTKTFSQMDVLERRAHICRLMGIDASKLLVSQFKTYSAELLRIENEAAGTTTPAPQQTVSKVAGYDVKSAEFLALPAQERIRLAREAQRSGGR
ncbi:MAG: hypothetical protein AB7L90_19185 [Hyphomicrobiaceae bacterium]